MPELPDVVVYIEALERRVLGRALTGVRIASPSVLRTFDPPYDAAVGREVRGLRRVGKRIVFEFPDDLFMVIHLMIAGRLRWLAPGASVPRKVGLAALDFTDGTLVLTEQGTKKRAGLWGKGEAGCSRPGRDRAARDDTREWPRRCRRRTAPSSGLSPTPALLGIGNAYPTRSSGKPDSLPPPAPGHDREELQRLHRAIRLPDRLDREAEGRGGGGVAGEGDGVPARHGGAHGNGEPCPRCGSAAADRLLRQRRTTAPPARPGAVSWPTGRCRC